MCFIVLLFYYQINKERAGGDRYMVKVMKKDNMLDFYQVLEVSNFINSEEGSYIIAAIELQENLKNRDLTTQEIISIVFKRLESIVPFEQR